MPRTIRCQARAPPNATRCAPGFNACNAPVAHAVHHASNTSGALIVVVSTCGIDSRNPEASSHACPLKLSPYGGSVTSASTLPAGRRGRIWTASPRYSVARSSAYAASGKPRGGGTGGGPGSGMGRLPAVRACPPPCATNDASQQVRATPSAPRAHRPRVRFLETVGFLASGGMRSRWNLVDFPCPISPTHDRQSTNRRDLFDQMSQAAPVLGTMFSERCSVSTSETSFPEDVELRLLPPASRRSRNRPLTRRRSSSRT